MSKYTATIDFESDTTEEEANEWFTMLMDSFPEGVDGRLKMHPELVDVEDLAESHVGSTIKIFVPGIGEVSGKLEQVYKGSPKDDTVRVLVIDGMAHRLTYGVAQLNEW
jgi:hypothetical protein